MKPRAVFTITAFALSLMTAWTSGCSKKSEEPPIRARELRPDGTELFHRQAVPGGKKKEKSSGRGGGGYSGVLINTYRKGKEVPAVAALKQEIQAFNGLEARYPRSLKELEEYRKAPLPKLPKGLEYDYNPSTGHLDTKEVD
jgi:hypothetical protein